MRFTVEQKAHIEQLIDQRLRRLQRQHRIEVEALRAEIERLRDRDHHRLGAQRLRWFCFWKRRCRS
jgi:uncharacterized protein involved in exopolysaccharide biosynthesis